MKHKHLLVNIITQLLTLYLGLTVSKNYTQEMRKCPQFLFNLISIYLRRSFEIDLINISVVHLCGSVKWYSPGRLLDLSSLTPLISGPRGWRRNSCSITCAPSVFRGARPCPPLYVSHSPKWFINTFSKNCHICY